MRTERTLILCEKPNTAQRVAKALDGYGKPREKRLDRVPFYEAERDGKELLVVPALGHLYTIAPKETDRNIYPVLDFDWIPRHAAERKAAETRAWIEAISKLSHEATEFILATDYDVEGETLGYTILKYACGSKEKDARRMKFSTLTTDELRTSFTHLADHIDFTTVEAGLCRHFLDALYGINLSRALTIAAKSWSGRFTVLSTGRVQGPALRFLVDREKKINSFVPTPFWSVSAEVEINGSIFEVEYEREVIERRGEAQAIVEACRAKKGKITETEVKEIQQSPPLPFDLGALQTEAYSLFKFTPKMTGDIAERLYLEALISYPRTASQRLPPSINYVAIIESLSRSSEYNRLCAELLGMKQLVPREGARQDPAHPAIYPTGSLPERGLSGSERRLWDLVVRRFMAVFGEPCLKRTMKVCIAVDGHRFYLWGRRVLKEGWTVFYKSFLKAEEVLLPRLEEGQEVAIKRIELEDRFTKPPPRYNPSSLLKKMEEEGIGTKATRASIIDTLYNRGYVTEERAVVSELGFDVIDVLDKHCPEVISVGFTRELEKSMEKIQNGKERMETVINKAVTHLGPVLEKLKEHQEAVGQELSVAIRKAHMQRRMVGVCPICGVGKLMIMYSRQTGKQFIGCTGFFKGLCKASFPLPQTGNVEAARRSCRDCGWPMMRVHVKSRRAWTFCINQGCPSKGGRK